MIPAKKGHSSNRNRSDNRKRESKIETSGRDKWNEARYQLIQFNSFSMSKQEIYHRNAPWTCSHLQNNQKMSFLRFDSWIDISAPLQRNTHGKKEFLYIKSKPLYSIVIWFHGSRWRIQNKNTALHYNGIFKW